jgi:Integrase zinc binding domain
LTDPYLKNIYLYSTQGLLSGSDSVDRITLLLADDFFLDENQILYRISLPQGKKSSRVQSTEICLALSQKYLAQIVQKAHDMGEFSKERTVEFFRTRIYAKNLWDAILRYQNSGDRCQQNKNVGQMKSPQL